MIFFWNYDITEIKIYFEKNKDILDGVWDLYLCLDLIKYGIYPEDNWVLVLGLVFYVPCNYFH